VPLSQKHPETFPIKAGAINNKEDYFETSTLHLVNAFQQNWEELFCSTSFLSLSSRHYTAIFASESSLTWDSFWSCFVTSGWNPGCRLKKCVYSHVFFVMEAL
jgi:hypothetical protein